MVRTDMSTLEIIPAIDLLGGNAVRLREGKRDEATIYSSDPVALIETWAEAGARRVHVVDLDGAFAGDRTHRKLVETLIKHAGIPVQVGGGLRTADAISACLDAGAAAAVVGTAAVKAATEVAVMCGRYPGRVIVAVDARDGVVTTEGWTEASELTALELSKRAADWGAAAVLYTDVARDGTEEGPNIAATAALAASMEGRLGVIASGGVGTLEHIRAVAGTGAASVIVGRALYENRFTLEEATEATELGGRA